MKLKRLLASVLALLLVVSLLPMTALAVDDNDVYLPENTGEIGTNYGTIDKNTGTVYKNHSWEGPGWNIGENGTKDGGPNSGTVNTNSGKINNNYGTVKINNEGIPGSYQPTVNNNYGLVGENNGLVENNRMKGEVATNNGTVSNNYGLVGKNSNTVGNNKSTGKVSTNDGTVDLNMGTVETNNKKVNTNSGKVTENNGSITTNGSKGEITTNNKDLKYNKGTVNTNAANGTVTNNWGNIGTNDGTVNKNSTTKDTQGNEFKGVIDTNNGTIKTNAEGATVVTNANGGKVEQNSGEVQINFGTVGKNESGGTVGEDVEYDPATGYYCFSHSGGNFGTITTNEGIVSQNGGEMYVSDGNGGYIVNEYDGTINTNAQSGTVLRNSDGSTITENYGTVVDNDGTVTNKDGGEVKFNQGTVINEEGGKLYEYVVSDYRTDEAPELTKTITEAGTYHCISVDKGYLHEDADAYTWTYTSALLQKRNGDIIDLTQLFKQDGYKVASYYEQVGKDYVEGTGTTFTASDKPSYLYLIWEKIQEICSSVSTKQETEPVKTTTPSIPTTVAAEDVKVGTVVRVKGQIFKVIEMDDGSITVVTMGKLSKKDLADLKAFLSKYLTPEQIELLLGDPELISQELAAKLFGGNTNHIVFKAAKNLFA